MTGMSNQSGSTMLIVMVVAVVMIITIFAMMRLAADDAVLATADAQASQAFYSAEAGAGRGAAWLLGQASQPSTSVNPFGDRPETFAGGLYFVTITPDFTGPRPVYTVTSYATVAGRSRAVEIDVSPISFTDYLYYIDKDVGFGSPGYFRTGDVIDGPIHLDDELAVWGDPVFQCRVESSASTILYENGGADLHSGALSNLPYDDPTFEEGCVLGADDFAWITQSDFNALKNMADISANSAEVVFGRQTGTGRMLGWVSYRKIGKTKWNDIELSSTNGIIYVNGSCEVSGVLDGQATIVSNGNMDIVNDLVYADRDGDAPSAECDDILGLVASSHIRVSDNAPNGSDCVVHAHMISINTQGGMVEHYDQGSPRGTLTLYGGVAQDKWGPIGTGYYDENDEFHVLTGYERDFHYDWRLQETMPPGYSLLMSGLGFARTAWREVAPLDLEEMLDS